MATDVSKRLQLNRGGGATRFFCETSGRGNAVRMNLFRWSPRIACVPNLGEIPVIVGKEIPYLDGSSTPNLHCFSVGG
jgi:hypothetical protein